MKSYHHFYDTTSTIFDIVSTLFLSPHPMYWWYDTNFIYEISSSIYVEIISIVYNSIITIFVTPQPLYLFLTLTLSMILHPWYIWNLTHYIWYHSHCICMVTPALSMPSQKLWKSSHLAPIWYYTHCISYLIHPLWHQSSLFMTSQRLNSWHQISSIWHYINSLGHHRKICVTSCLLYLTSRPLYLCHHTHPIDDITETTWMVSHAVYLWHHIRYVSDKISTKYDITTLCVDVTTLGICVTSFALQMTSHPLYHTKKQYLWCHIHFRHDITPAVSDTAPTVSLSSQTLHWYHTHFWMTSHPPSVWHHMHHI